MVNIILIWQKIAVSLQLMDDQVNFICIKGIVKCFGNI